MTKRHFGIYDESGTWHEVVIAQTETLASAIRQALGLDDSASVSGFVLEDSRRGPIQTNLTVSQAMIVDSQSLYLRTPSRRKLFSSRKPKRMPDRHAEPPDSPIVEFGEVVHDKVLPFYLLVDTSLSMQSSMQAMNREISNLWTEIRLIGDLRDACRLSTITFGERAEVHVPLTEVTLGESEPPRNLVANGSFTNYEDGFRLTARRIEADCDRLKHPFRPVVYIFSDGQPNRGDTADGLRFLTSRKTYTRDLRPNIVTFGFGSANEDVMRAIQNRGGFMQDGPDANLGSAVSWLLSSLIGSLSADIADSGQTQSDVVDNFVSPRGDTEGWRPIVPTQEQEAQR